MASNSRITQVAGCVTALALLLVTGCDSASPGPIALRVGGAPVSVRTVEHWSSVIERGAIVPNLTGEAHPAPRRQALAFLIAAAWLAGEARRDDLELSHRKLEGLIAGGKGFPGGGETRADFELEAGARWAASVLKGRMSELSQRRAKAALSDGAIMSFYRAHIASKRLPERRRYDLVEGIDSFAAAERLRTLGAGSRFSARAAQEHPFRPPAFVGARGQFYRAVFSARVGVLMGPLPLDRRYALFVLRRIEPPGAEPLSRARGRIDQTLYERGLARARSQLEGEYRRRWTLQTDCLPGYVVQKCKQYGGGQAPERDPFAGF
jgi:hypothetical protein